MNEVYIMKRVILFIALIFPLASPILQASQSHLPCNMAYSIASYAGSMLNSLVDEPNSVSSPLVQALLDVKSSYTELAISLSNSDNLHDDALILMDSAATLLDNVVLNFATQLGGHQAIVERMLAINERLKTALW